MSQFRVWIWWFAAGAAVYPGGRFAGGIKALLGVALACASRITRQVASRDSSSSSSCKIRFIAVESFHRCAFATAPGAPPQRELYHLLAA